FTPLLFFRRFYSALTLVATHTPRALFPVYIAQHTTGVPALALLEPGDLAFSTHRNHGHLLARGADPGCMLAEILGKATGYNKGKGGTLHISSAAHGFPATSASTGGNVPVAVGAAFAFKERGVDRVSVCLFGDGALEEGAYHEAINIAALRALPVIFLCENNSLEALGQKANEYPSSTLAAVRLTDLAKPFRVPAVDIDGADMRAVHRTMKRAVARARAGEGPTFIEARTVRWPGSRPLWPELATGRTDLAMAWDESRIPDQHREWHRSQDGLLQSTRALLRAGHLTRDRALQIDQEVGEQIDQAGRFALDSP
ncbi:MAG: thiamine pyrophosphate-dependent dehydrogenase E1 component subunit alpha, partial [Armatimonadota bacterium]